MAAAQSSVSITGKTVTVSGVSSRTYDSAVEAHRAAREAAHKLGLKEFIQHVSERTSLRWSVGTGRSDFGESRK